MAFDPAVPEYRLRSLEVATLAFHRCSEYKSEVCDAPRPKLRAKEPQFSGKGDRGVAVISAAGLRRTSAPELVVPYRA